MAQRGNDYTLSSEKNTHSRFLLYILENIWIYTKFSGNVEDE